MIFKLLPFYFLFIVKANAQPPNQGKMYNGLETTKITYLRDNNPNDNRTKYTIILNGNEIYEVNFTYYKELGDSIEIAFVDKQTFKSEKPAPIKFDRKDSKVIICDYQRNKEPINDKDGTYKILFSIDKPKMQFITLYQFQPPANLGLQFILQSVSDSVIKDHYNAVGDYKRNKKILDDRDTAIATLKRAMLNYKDSIIEDIRQKEYAKTMGRNKKDADTAMRKDFKQSMDSIFINYFKNIYPYSNEGFEVNFTFLCKGNGKIIIDTIPDITFISGTQINWLRDSFILRIKPSIEAREFTTPEEYYSYPNLKSELRGRFKDNTTLYSQVFEETYKQIDSAFDKYHDRTVPVPTQYSYRFKYKSETKSPSWKYNVNMEGTGKFVDQSTVSEQIERTPDMERLFIKKIADPNTKKYNLQVCTIYINDQEMGLDIRKNPNKVIQLP